MKRKIGLSLLFGFMVILILLFLADVRKVAMTLRTFQWIYAPLIIGFTLLNYGLRFVKWHYYVRLLHIRNISVINSARVYFSAFFMVMTPGKLGEFFKAYLLSRITGTPVAVTAPMVVAERITDGVSMTLLAMLGLITYPQASLGVGLSFLALVAFIALIQVRPLALRLLSFGERLPGVRGFSHAFYEAYQSAYRLFRWDALLVATVLGLISWGSEGVAFYLVWRGLGIPGSLTLLSQAVFIMAFGIIVGAVSALPGGVGAAESSMAGLSFLLIAHEETTAIVGTLLGRIFTLWFGVLLGLFIFTLNRRWLLGDVGIDAAEVSFAQQAEEEGKP